MSVFYICQSRLSNVKASQVCDAMPTRPPQHKPAGWLSPIERARLVEQARPSARQRGYSARWERESREFLALPGNRHCACGCGRLANAVDHIKAHKGDVALFWDKANWQAMWLGCNSRKAAAQEGGFGNPTR
jgi:5-methylcytosine-specific restriction protein A